MKVRFWGTRGSIPTPGKQTARYGGNTSCVEIRTQNELLVFDAGTGLRQLGLRLLEAKEDEGIEAHMFISHTHWDHIQGLPFFVPVYMPGNLFHLYATLGKAERLQSVLRGQMESDYFPVRLDTVPADMNFRDFPMEKLELSDATVSSFRLSHPGGATAFRIEHDNRSVVYATDNELRAPAYPEFRDDYIKFVKDADLLIADAQYTEDEYPTKVGWGHSTMRDVIDAALEANVRRIALYHHDPLHSDPFLDARLAEFRAEFETRGEKADVFFAREGMTLKV